MEPISYLQTDPRWASKDYSAKGESTTIGKAGCGPTCMAMVIASLKDKTVTPAVTAAWSLKKGYKACNQGTYYTYFKPQGAAYGINVTQLNSSNLYKSTSSSAKSYHNRVVTELKAGNWVIACMGKGNWTSTGHFVLAYKVSGNTVYIRDPNSTKATRVKANINTWQNEVKYYFLVETQLEDEEMDQKTFNKMMDVYLAEKAKEAPSDWSKESREWAEKNGIITGSTSGFNYKSNCTREQMVTFLHRLYLKLTK